MLEILNDGPVRPYMTQLADMPYTASHTVTTSKDGELYVLGGLSNSLTSMTQFAAYNRSTNRWRSLSPYTEPVRSPVVGSYGGKITAMGGYNQGTATPSRNIRDYVASWSVNTTSLAQPKFDARYTQTDADGNFYILGGNISGSFSAEFIKVNIASMTPVFTTLAPYSVPIRQAGLIIKGNLIYALGGLLNNGESTNLFRVYDIAKNQWTTLAPCPSTCEHANLLVRGDKIYALFYRSTLAANPGNYLCVYDTITKTWEYLGDLGGIVCGLTVGTVFGDSIILCGGWNGTTRHNHVMRLTVL